MLPRTAELDPLLTTPQAAEILGFSPRALEGWRLRGNGPPYLKIGGRRAVRYRLSDIMSWCESDRRTSTSDPVPESV